VRGLILKITLLAAALATFLVAALDFASGVPTPVLLWRGALTFAIVVGTGTTVGWILMRTVLRRRYEEWRLTQSPPRARADR
jgi:hypothetical protein